MKAAGEVLADLLAVDQEFTLAGADDDPRDRGLSLAGRLDPGALRKLELCALADRRLLGDEVGLCRRGGLGLLALGLKAGALLCGELALFLDQERFEVGAGGDVLLLCIGRRSLGGLLGGRDFLGGSRVGSWFLCGCLVGGGFLSGFLLGGSLVFGSTLRRRFGHGLLGGGLVGWRGLLLGLPGGRDVGVIGNLGRRILGGH